MFRIAMDDRFASARLSDCLANERYGRATCDLLSRIQSIAPRRIAYLQVGEPSVEARLARRYPDADYVTLDISQQDRPSAATMEREFDLIFSSGDLELLPSLGGLLPILVTRLKSGGLLALHIPNNLYEPNRALARMVAADGPWATTLLPIAKTRPFNATMEGLYALLKPSCKSVEIWETTYLFALNGIEGIVDFMKPRSLAPFLTSLDPCSRSLFLERYVSELRSLYPTQPDGAVLFRLPMIFVLAAR